VSLHRETHENGLRWMPEHGYTSWDGLIRGVIAGHVWARPANSESGGEAILHRLDELAQAIDLLKARFASVDVRVNPDAASKIRKMPMQSVDMRCPSCAAEYTVRWDPGDEHDLFVIRGFLENPRGVCPTCSTKRPANVPRVFGRTSSRSSPKGEGPFMLLVDMTAARRKADQTRTPRR